MKTLYFDCGMGAAGDMLMASLYEICPDKEKFLKMMNGMGIPGLSVEAEPSVKCGITGTHMKVTIHGEEEESVDVDLQGHEHHHDHECCHHDHDEDEHEHHHHDGECGCGHHHHHHGHDADEVFSNFGVETAKKFTREELENALSKLSGEEYGTVLRAKGIVAGADGVWYHFDFVPEEYEVRTGSADVTGRMCVIGAKLAEDKIKALFGV